MSQVASATARGIGIGQVKHLAVLGLERVGAGGRGAHDPVARPRERGQLRQVSARLAFGRGRTGRSR